MKILHLLCSDFFSGAENVVCQIINLFKDDENIEMAYCSPDGKIAQSLNERKIKFLPLHNFSLKGIKKVIREYKPDIIHAHDMRASFYAALAKNKNITLISHIHNNNFDSRKLSFKSLAYIYAAKKSKHIFWVSRSSYEGYKFHNYFKNKSSILYNIIDIDSLYLKANTDNNNYDYDIVYVGRLTYQKNPERLIKVCKSICNLKEDVKIAIVGTGDLESQTKALVKSLSVEKNISFLGFQSNPLKILKDSKVMIMTSLWEGTPMCVLEAMALGVPIVSTPVDGLKDLIINGTNGFLSDNDDELAKKSLEIIVNSNIHQNYSNYMMNQSKKINDKIRYKESILNCYNS